MEGTEQADIMEIYVDIVVDGNQGKPALINQHCIYLF